MFLRERNGECSRGPSGLSSSSSLSQREAGLLLPGGAVEFKHPRPVFPTAFIAHAYLLDHLGHFSPPWLQEETFIEENEQVILQLPEGIQGKVHIVVRYRGLEAQLMSERMLQHQSASVSEGHCLARFH